MEPSSRASTNTPPLTQPSPPEITLQQEVLLHRLQEANFPPLIEFSQATRDGLPSRLKRARPSNDQAELNRELARHLGAADRVEQELKAENAALTRELAKARHELSMTRSIVALAELEKQESEHEIADLRAQLAELQSQKALSTTK